MPHDKRGVLVETGDLVVGKGYNVSGDIVGLVLRVDPKQTACNIQVLHAVFKPVAKDVVLAAADAGIPYATLGIDNQSYGVIGAKVEYGQCDQFEVLRKADGRVPDPAPVVVALANSQK